MVIDVSHQGILLWPSVSDHVYWWRFTAYFLTVLWLHPLLSLRAEKVWVSLGVLFSLALGPFNACTGMPFIRVVIFYRCVLPVWCAWRGPDWPMFSASA